jgi:Ras-related GTP-binding protein C/D
VEASLFHLTAVTCLYFPECYAEIQRALSEELEDYPYYKLQSLSTTIDFSDPLTISSLIEHLTGETRFDMTSCHDVTLRDAWSKVIQGMTEVLPAVEQLLLNFNAVCI